MKINEPAGNGAYEGDEFFGLEGNNLIATHVWRGGGWHRVPMVMGTTEDPIPGLEDIPADIPNAPEGEMPLHYDVQTFNALVAANTAQQTEISSLESKIQMLIETGERDREAIANYEESLGDLQAMRREDRATIKLLTETNAEQSRTLKELTAVVEAHTKNLRYELERSTTLNLQLERMKGYLDRTLEQDEQFDKTPAVPEQPILRPRGPRIGGIPMPVRDTERAPYWDAHEIAMQATAGARRPSRTF